MFDEDQILFTDNDTHKYNNNKYSSPIEIKNSTLGFDECVKLDMFKNMRGGGSDWNPLRNSNTIPDNSLVYLTQSNQLLNSFDMKLKFDSLIAEKKLKNSFDAKKMRYEKVKERLNENRNPNIGNLLKDLIKTPAQSTIQKLREDYNSELGNILSSNVESLPYTESRDSAKLMSRESKKTIILEDSAIFEQKIQEESNEDNFFITENQQENLVEDIANDDCHDDIDEKPQKSPSSSLLLLSDDENEENKFTSTNFEEKYAHLLSETSDLTTKSSSTIELMNDEVKVSDKTSKKTSKSKKKEIPVPVLPPIDHEKIARDMRITLFNSIHPSESSLIRFNSKLDNIKQIHLPTFQGQFHQVCQYGDDSRIVKLITEV